MGYNVKLTVHDVLQRPHFKRAEVVAGMGGLCRVVDWVHIAEVSQISHLLNGNELILSTGVGWGAEKEGCLSFLNQLINRNAAGLCIELGTFFSELPQEMTRLADEHQFPLIVFTQEVRFVDITQDLHTLLHETEKKRMERERWILNWLHGSCEEKEILLRLRAMNVTSELSGVVACIVTLEEPPPQNTAPASVLAQIAIDSSSLFEQHGFFLLTTIDESQLVYILLDEKERGSWKRRALNAITHLRKSAQTNYSRCPHIRFNIGKIVSELSCLHASFTSAKEVLHIHANVKIDGGVLFYEDLHIYRLVAHMEKTGGLREFVMDYLEPVIQYDRTRQGNMMHTLKTFLSCNGSKQETAARLFIVRQTLYHRLEKLEELLGTDFMKPEKRVAIEVAIFAYEYLQRSDELYNTGR